jgi:hypothetical protein
MQHHVKRTLADGRVIPIPDVSYPGGGGGGAPDPHASTHEDAGSDEIDVTDLSGRLADDQPFDLDDVGSTQGQVLYRGASAWAPLSPGTDGQLLATQGAAANPQWVNRATILTSPDGEYHPDIPPDSMFASESWAGGVADQTWAWANQGSASEVLERDGAKIINPITTQSWAVRYADMLPSTGDFTFAAKMSCGYWAEDTGAGVATSLGGILVVTEGTITSPTQLYAVAQLSPGSSTSSVFAVRGTNYTTGAAGNVPFGNVAGMYWTHFYVMIQWDDGLSGNERLGFFTSGNGMDWHKRNDLTGTVAGRPVTDLGWFAKAVSTRLEWIRVFDSLTFEVGNRP